MSKNSVLQCTYGRFLAVKKILALLVILSLSPAALARPASIMVLGDSLSAAYGIAVEQGWVYLLEQQLSKQFKHAEFTVINASISGETTGGALLRLPSLLEKHQPDIVIIELGGNDGLRGFPIRTLRDNLDQLITLSKAAKAKVVLAGMRIPPNYGTRYAELFAASFELAARKHQALLIPFLLTDVAVHAELMQHDGIHPTAEAQPRILDNVLPVLTPLL